jgi:hypothetical protein
MTHKWDIITDTCIKCGLERRNKRLYFKGTLTKSGYLTEYLVNNEWIANVPECNEKRDKNRTTVLENF